MKRLAQLRKERQLSQTGFAMKMNLSQYLISSYENGRHQPSIEMLIKFSDFFNVSIDYLVGHSCMRSPSVLYTETGLSQDEISLLDYYRVLSGEQKKVASEMLRILKNYNNQLDCK